MTGGWILAFDTATRATAVGLSGPGGELFEARDDQPSGQRPQHAALLLPLCTQVLDQAGIAFTGLERIAVGIGPGTFTGLRIGVATARALSRAAEVPLVGVSTHRSLALNGLAGGELPELTGPAGREVVLAVLDARRQEVFAAAWRRDDEDPLSEPLITPSALAPGALAEELRHRGLAPLAVGEGAVAFREVLERSGAFVPDDDSQLHRVTAANHCRIAGALKPSDPERVQPLYLRLPDAELARRAAGKQ